MWEGFREREKVDKGAQFWGRRAFFLPSSCLRVNGNTSRFSVGGSVPRFFGRGRERFDIFFDMRLRAPQGPMLESGLLFSFVDSRGNSLRVSLEFRCTGDATRRLTAEL